MNRGFRMLLQQSKWKLLIIVEIGFETGTFAGTASLVSCLYDSCFYIMRTFVILLIVANLAYLAWNLFSGPPPEQVMVRAPVRTAPETLQLLKEVAPAPESAPAPETCLSLGVFSNTEESDFFVSALKQRGMDARVELLQAGESVNYRVYMPPFNSELAGRQALEELQGEGIDSFIISSGELAGGISLGLFTQEERALGLQEQLAALGFATSIQEIPTAATEIWVTIVGLSATLLESTNLLDLLSEGLELEVLEKPCETIASSP